MTSSSIVVMAKGVLDLDKGTSRALTLHHRLTDMYFDECSLYSNPPQEDSANLPTTDRLSPPLKLKKEEDFHIT